MLSLGSFVQALFSLSVLARASAFAIEFEGSCAHLVDLPEIAPRFRLELLHSVSQYTRKFRDEDARRSNLNADEDAEITANWDPVATLDDDVVSLGSGPDIMRAIFNFPFAKHIHLVDVLEGWGNARNAGVTLAELERRLHHIGTNVEVTIVRKGFFIERTREQFYELGPYRSVAPMEGETKYIDMFDDACTWKIEWDSSVAGRQVRYVSLHIFDYDAVVSVEEVLKDIPASKFGGLLITGSQIPVGEPLQILLNAMKPRGLFVAEMDYMRLDGSGDNEESDAVREQLARSVFHTEHALPRSALMMQLNPHLYWPRTYLFRKL